MNSEYTVEILTGDTSEYDAFINEHPSGSFYQCSAWREVKDNWRSEIVVVRNSDGKICGGALVLIRQLPLIKLSMLYIPRGPVYDFHDEAAAAKLFEGIKIVSKRHRACMIRIDPRVEEKDSEAIEVLAKNGFKLHDDKDEESLSARMKPIYVLDLKGKTAEEIFEGFHSKWRYNIRLAKRKGVECRVCGKEALEDFHRLMKITGERDHFNIRPVEYFAKFMDEFGENCRLYMCYYEGVALSGALSVKGGGKTCCYIYGASSNENRNVMPNYLMQWEMIQWAIESGCDIYDFVGVPHYNDENHREYGVYRFKKGFGGRVVVYAGAFDKINLPLVGHAVREYIDRK